MDACVPATPTAPPTTPLPQIVIVFACSSAFSKVTWLDLERLLREKADAAALAELEKTCTTSVALERVELGLSRAVGLEEVNTAYELYLQVAVGDSIRKRLISTVHGHDGDGSADAFASLHPRFSRIRVFVSVMKPRETPPA